MTAEPAPATTGGAPDSPGSSLPPGGVERRAAHASRRLKPSLVPSITGIMVGFGGPRMNLVNISTSGVLIEGPQRLKPGNEVKLVFEGGFSPSTVPSRVVRTLVTGIGRDGVLHYQVGLAFLSPVELPVPEEDDCRAEPEPRSLPEDPPAATEESASALEEQLVAFEQVCLPPEPNPALPRNRW
jgi:hypothetical protein